MSNIAKESFVRKDDPKYIDLLDEDMPIAGQKFACLSFVSPEKILKQKELFFLDKFLNQFDLSKSLEKFTQFLNFVSYKYKLDFDKLTKDLHEFTEEEKGNLFLTTLEDEYKSYVDNHEEKLEQLFNENHDFQTSTRGIKVRGTFPSQQEAEFRCKILREMDPNHDVFVGPVGVWMPWDPEAYKTGRVEYLEEQLNQIMNEKQKNEKNAKQEFENRVKETKRKAIEENIEKAKKSGNVLTQTINDDGQLVNVKNINTTENALLKQEEVVSSETIKKQLFEGENVVMDKDTDHGLSQLKKMQIDENTENVENGTENENVENENVENELEEVD
jgi:hypothetical protein